MHFNRGFTLIEILIVMLLIAVSSALFLGFNAQQQFRFRAQSAARQLYALVHTAQGYAILDHAENICSYDPVEHAIVEKLRGKKLMLPPSVTASLVEQDGTPFVSSDQKADEAIQLVRFYPDGGADGSLIRLEAGGKTLFVIVDPILGEPKILEYPPAKSSDAAWAVAIEP